MPGPLITLIILAACVGAVGLMWLGWRHRRRAQAGIAAPPELPAELGAPELALDDVHYVATSTTGQALDRITVEPLGYRGRATVEVHPGGLAVGIAASRPFFIPRERIEAIARAQATIDRAVERDGLLVVRWLLEADRSVETYFRVVDPAERRALADALTALVPESHPQELA